MPQVWSLGGLWRSGHEPPLLRVVQPGGPFGMAGGARGWVAGRAGLWGVPPTGGWVVGTSPQKSVLLKQTLCTMHSPERNVTSKKFGTNYAN